MYVIYGNQTLSQFAECVLDKYRRTNLLNNNTTAVHDPGSMIKLSRGLSVGYGYETVNIYSQIISFYKNTAEHRTEVNN